MKEEVACAHWLNLFTAGGGEEGGGENLTV